ncbi:cytochrome c [Aquisalimonas lutea]|uniref:c-type cytochrome n=1 Tax=Aquisalimonas lutea TaxID=1327750 RepID=UPI0025B3F8F8|nr:cytochrome c [Aquisalimonas lutea]MDN3519231.1 cytochrome c [Aquisalimonas lutea]
MRLTTLLLGLTLGAVAAGGTAQAQEGGDPVVGEQLATTCMGCHAVEGARNAYPSYRVPKLGGQYAEYLVSALQAYKNGDREHPTMQAQAAGLSEQEMRDIAAFFAQQP